ncbi:hypothetical protein [Streptomyces sp. AD55]|uniref:hypothetical protein n=1 Tax=Streptomyces sp. AD55 TaxID=3242895 RepID=UPI0035271276
MGRSTNALLAYGYDLGGPDEWKVQETCQYGGLTVEWHDEEDDENDFIADAVRRLDAELRGHHIEIETHCSDGSPSYLLALDVTTAHRGHPESVDFQDLTRSRLAGDWDDQLAQALRALGLTPLQEAPAWLLASYADGF